MEQPEPKERLATFQQLIYNRWLYRLRGKVSEVLVLQKTTGKNVVVVWPFFFPSANPLTCSFKPIFAEVSLFIIISLIVYRGEIH